MPRDKRFILLQPSVSSCAHNTRNFWKQEGKTGVGGESTAASWVNFESKLLISSTSIELGTKGGFTLQVK